MSWTSERRKNPSGSSIKDRLGREICHGDTLRFVDKLEWYRTSHIRASAEEIQKLPFEERKITLPQDYEWLMTGEIQRYWQVVKHNGKSLKAAV